MTETISQLDRYVRAANYLTVAQLYLQGNQLLTRPLEPSDIKPRLLGHWGTCPGINFIYAHLNRLIKQEQAELLLILGPGHGFPALQANLFLEGTLGEYYPQATRDRAGIEYLTRQFSWPGGFPSHTNPGTPGAILEGGELGYSLATAYGAVLDSPELIAACVIGDGEAETGPLAAAWQLVKLVDPGTNGTVLPILHLNGYKISQPTLFGRMSTEDLQSYFHGLGYLPILVDAASDNGHESMIAALDVAYNQIRLVKTNARANPTGGPWQMPVIILRTPKGWTGIKELGGEPIEGTWRSHQIPAPCAKSDPTERALVEGWLRSYRFDELFDVELGFVSDVLSLIPKAQLRMGKNPKTFGGSITVPLDLPDVGPFAEDATAPGTIGSSSMRRAGAYLADVFRRNEDSKNFRFFSPDETYSNKLDEIFTATERAYAARTLPTDIDQSPAGRSVELLSEHALQGLLQGYVLTGRHGVFASYEAFAPIVSSMLDQYAKFLKVAKTIAWRGDISSLNYILTSSGWRQEHNGFSHQNPGFLDDVLRRHSHNARVYLPADATSMLAVLRYCLASTNGINVIVAGKTVEPRWLTPALALRELESGMMTWEFASDDNPDIVFVGIGDYLTKEALAAVQLLKSDIPHVRLRFVNVLELSCLARQNNRMRDGISLIEYLTASKPVIVNFHGYPETIQQLLFASGIDPRRVSIHGYLEQGSTTTPFDMQVRNQTSRYHLAIDATQHMIQIGVIDTATAAPIIDRYQHVLDQHQTYIREHGVDLPEVEDWQWIPRA